ncbi:LAQU0S01e11474g1_1 [Lachancea quebecensis]|uniref:glutaminase n=1 Tax=Lachancea quebecensis TaxID=1654605 RepID=A0A0P1KLS4_9SACH|nr:LAQU0S01e11474g1_1 [Lachancea quebecensis]
MQIPTPSAPVTCIDALTAHETDPRASSPQNITSDGQARTVGVLALQGAFAEHVDYFEACIAQYGHPVHVTLVRTAAQLDRCDALVIPGGESTAMTQIASRMGLHEALARFVQDPRRAVWGTCAGLILLAREAADAAPASAPQRPAALVEPLQALEVAVRRNAFGRQAQSFVATCDFSAFLGPTETQGFPAVFIRAPVIEHVLDPERVEVLHRLAGADGTAGTGPVVAVRQGRILGTSFHPELADDTRFHDWFLREFVLRDTK